MLIHHNKLRVNARIPDDDDLLNVLRDSGWASGLHKDSDPEDPALIRDETALPRVLDPQPVEETEDESSKSAAKKSSASRRSE